MPTHELSPPAPMSGELPTQRQALEALASHAYDDIAITEVVRPAAVLPESAARRVLAELSVRDARADGLWVAEPARWQRYDSPWDGIDEGPGHSRLMGTLQVIYGRPGRYDITVFRVTITALGAAAGWQVESLCDEAFAFAELTLASCPRADLPPPPAPLGPR
jgi:hypothetical protein